MNITTINGAMLRNMFLSGAALLEQNKAHIDALNVFPVPDGDTGTNMCMTMRGAIKELKTLPDDISVDQVMTVVASGSLRGARGNSGVILSQLFRGFAKRVKGNVELDASTFALALNDGTQAAYKAVMKPREGTILTVSRMMAEAAAPFANGKNPNVNELFDTILEAGETALALTPTLLPVLKEAGVVDSGGKGLLIIYRGFAAALSGEDLSEIEIAVEEPVETNEQADLESFTTDTIEFGYCTEFFIVRLVPGFSEKDLDVFREHLMRIGDSVVVASDADMVKVHVHSDCPGKILQMAMRYGELDRLKIENMREQNRQLLENRRRNEAEYAMIAVSTGEGVNAIFSDLSVNKIIQGGQTMNPSIDTIVNAIRLVNARNVFVLPNNSNIILAAEQAKELCDVNVIVLPTKTIPQGIAAAMTFNPDDGVEENKANMLEAIEQVISGAITYAVRDTQYNGTKINSGDIIGIMDGDIVVVNGEVDEAGLMLLRKMIAKRAQSDPVVTLFHGESVDKERAEALAEQVNEEFPDAEVLIQDGGQPLYYYYFSVE
ncbi:MAG: DAK2 domain-containing protein [Clostridia bacterium]|nr:DAK2 domain-containing protein [Clostridia bacterium]